MIELAHIRKEFVVSERPEGRFGALRGIFRREKRIVHALDDIGFTIQPGELVGYIGPNGAGKSTTVKVMSGILTPEGGQCHILGRVPWKQRVEHVADIGVVFGQRSQLWWDVPVVDSFELLRDIYGLPQEEYAQRLLELGEALDFASLLRTPVRQLSLGQRIRCEVAAALLHRPKVLFLDEPTIGLDAVSKLALRDFLLKENREKGTTMILTTHDMDDIEALCSRVMTIGRGRLLFDGNLTELKRRYAPYLTIRAELDRPAEGEAAIEGMEEAHLDERRMALSALYDPAKLPTHRAVERIAAAYSVRDVEILSPDIDQIIAAMYRELSL